MDARKLREPRRSAITGRAHGGAAARGALVARMSSVCRERTRRQVRLRTDGWCVIYVRVTTKSRWKPEPAHAAARARAVQPARRLPSSRAIQEGESAKTADRTELQKLRKYCRTHQGKVHTHWRVCPQTLVASLGTFGSFSTVSVRCYAPRPFRLESLSPAIDGVGIIPSAAAIVVNNRRR